MSIYTPTTLQIHDTHLKKPTPNYKDVEAFVERNVIKILRQNQIVDSRLSDQLTTWITNTLILNTP